MDFNTLTNQINFESLSVSLLWLKLSYKTFFFYFLATLVNITKRDSVYNLPESEYNRGFLMITIMIKINYYHYLIEMPIIPTWMPSPFLQLLNWRNVFSILLFRKSSLKNKFIKTEILGRTRRSTKLSKRQPTRFVGKWWSFR